MRGRVERGRGSHLAIWNASHQSEASNFICILVVLSWTAFLVQSIHIDSRSNFVMQTASLVEKDCVVKALAIHRVLESLWALLPCCAIPANFWSQPEVLPQEDAVAVSLLVLSVARFVEKLSPR